MVKVAANLVENFVDDVLIQAVEQAGHGVEHASAGDLGHFEQLVVDENDHSEKSQDDVAVAQAEGYLLTVHHLKEGDRALWRVCDAGLFIGLTRVSLRFVGFVGRE